MSNIGQYDETKHARSSDGKFAPKTTGEGDVTIEQTEDVWANIDSAEVIKMAETTAKLLARRSDDLDVQDIAGETILQVMTQVKRKGGVVPGNLGGFTRTLGQRVVAAKVYGTDRGADQSAIKMWQEECKRASEHFGRTLSAREQDEIAESVRNSQKPSQRARTNFHRPMATKTSHIEAMSNSDDGDTSDRASQGLEDAMRRYDVGVETHNQDYDEGSIGARATQAAESGDTETARTNVWDAVAQSERLSTSGPNLADEQTREKARADIESRGANVVSASIIDGSVEDETYNHFRQPWPHASNAEITEIAHSMTERPAYATDLWKAAQDSSVAKLDKVRGADLPRAQRQFLQADNAARAQAFVESRGGVASMSRSYLDGKISNRDADVLLAPWGGRAGCQQHARTIATRLAASDDPSGQWKKSLDSATKPDETPEDLYDDSYV